MNNSEQPDPASQPSPVCAPWFAPLLLAGSSIGGLCRVLLRNGFRVDWRYWPALVIAAALAAIQTLLRGLQRLACGRRVQATTISPAPIFIIGHWRTGTTLLHYLLTQDERFVGPNSYECFAPNHFVLTERWFMRWFGHSAPFRRPMDNMLTSLQAPQEDEFALMLRGQPSLYWSMVFPNEPPQDEAFLDLEDLPARRREQWKQVFHDFLQELTYVHGRRLVLKNPLHAARIRLLLEMFPEARFVNLVRDPHAVFPSTLHMHRTSALVYAWQKPTFAGLEERVLEFGSRLHEKVEESKPLIPAGQFHQIRYEDLIRDPLGELRRLYENLGLGEFKKAEPRLGEFVRGYAGYQTNRYEVPPERREFLERRWSEIIRAHGYDANAAP